MSDVTTGFSATEDPISDGGGWIDGAVNASARLASASGVCAHAGAGTVAYYYRSETFGAVQSAKLKMSVGPFGQCRVLVLASGTGAGFTCYEGTNVRNETFRLYKNVGGSLSILLDPVPVTFADGDDFEIRADAGTGKLQLFHNGTQLGTDVTNTDITSGAPGIGDWLSTSMDDFVGSGATGGGGGGSHAGPLVGGAIIKSLVGQGLVN